MNDKPLTFVEFRNANVQAAGGRQRIRDLPHSWWICTLAGTIGQVGHVAATAEELGVNLDYCRVMAEALGGAAVSVDQVAEKYGVPTGLFVSRLSASGVAVTDFRGLRAITKHDWRSPTETPDLEIPADALAAELLAAFAGFVTCPRAAGTRVQSTWAVCMGHLDLHLATMFGKIDRLAYRVGIDLGDAARGVIESQGRNGGSEITIQSSELTGDNQP